MKTSYVGRREGISKVNHPDCLLNDILTRILYPRPLKYYPTSDLPWCSDYVYTNTNCPWVILAADSDGYNSSGDCYLFNIISLLFITDRTIKAIRRIPEALRIMVFIYRHNFLHNN